MQLGQIAAEARPRQHRTDDDVPQRVSDEAIGPDRNNFQRERNLQPEWAAGRRNKIHTHTLPPTLLTYNTMQ